MMLHNPVLLQESLDALAIKPDRIYIDGTFGRGGHSQAILGRLSDKGRLFAIDKDSQAIAYAAEHFGKDPRFAVWQGSFKCIAEFAQAANIYGRVQGILLDLGLSSPQLDTPSRGFSFMQPGPLDMRMDDRAAYNAATFINQAKLETLVKVLREYGEERFALRIARAIVHAREQAPIKSTDALAAIVKAANPRWEKHKHPATRVFQAIRIHVNDELEDLKIALADSLKVLAVGGRLVVISFHSLEDRIVKQFMQKEAAGNCPPFSVPLKAVDVLSAFKRIGKAIKPQQEEVQRNVRARSAVLRTGEKTA